VQTLNGLIPEWSPHERYITDDSGNLFNRNPFAKDDSLIYETDKVILNPNNQAVAVRAMYEFTHVLGEAGSRRSIPADSFYPGSRAQVMPLRQPNRH
jgi:hypothetical protein